MMENPNLQEQAKRFSRPLEAMMAGLVKPDATYENSAQDSRDGLVDNLVSNLFDVPMEASARRQNDLDEISLGKLGQVFTSQMSSRFASPMHSMPSSHLNLGGLQRLIPQSRMVPSS